MVGRGDDLKRPNDLSDNLGDDLSGRLRASLPRLTPSERRAALYLLEHFPIAGLDSMVRFARAAHVSPQSVLRLIGKLGFAGYAGFQAALRSALTNELQSPAGRWHSHRPADGPEQDFLARFADRIAENVRSSLQKLPRAEFEAVACLLADEKRPLQLLGGRFTHAIARYFWLHLAVIRDRVSLVDGQAAGWPDHLLDVGRREVVLLFDIRRYQDDVIRFGELAAERGATVIVMTDSWNSPACRVARHVVTAQVESPSGWDSAAALLAIVEALIARVSELHPRALSDRLADLETLRLRAMEPPWKDPK